MTNTKSLIAVIGMGCRFPGNVSDADSYWNLLMNEVDAVNDIPASRWDMDAFYDSENTSGKMYTRQGGFLQDIEKFDNAFFKISPIEAESLDPQTRLLLELSYETLENANIRLDQMKHTATGVYMGMTIVDYIEKDIRSSNPHAINAYSVTGTQMSSASGRISYAYGLEGPSITLDTACSSSLVTIHLACKALQNHETDMAFAGGVNLITSPKYHISFCRLNALSPDCRCKAFDASGNGFVRSEGGGIILLKRYEDAVRDGNKILGVIAGSATTNDGTSKGYTVPNAHAQEKAIRLALQDAGLTPNDIDYFEAHGTGTPVGDPLEMQGIGNAFETRSVTQPLIVGSVKTNIGHCESAAGIAGFIKVLLCLQREKIPANLHFKNPNPSIPWNDLPVKIPTEKLDWPKGDKIRYGGVSSFGLSGTNANIILQEAPEKEPSVNHHRISPQHLILPISGNDKAAVKMLAQQYLERLESSPSEEIAVAAALHRSHLDCRMVITGKDTTTLQEQLKEALQNESVHHNSGEDKKIVFVFPGQGSQWIGMGLDLMQVNDVFRNTMMDCRVALAKYTDWDLLEEIQKPESMNRFGEVNIIQPILFSMEVALAKMWQSWGVNPDVVLGHSMGEAAAAYIASAITLDEAAAIICKRSLLARRLSGQGLMALTELTMADAMVWLEPYEGKVSVAASNGPISTVISGDENSVHEILSKLTAEGIFNRLINVNFASHSPQMDLLKDDLLHQLQDLQPKPSAIPVFSTVTNALLQGTEMNAQYWSDNLRNPVLFAPAVQTLLEHDNTIFIEISPHPILVQLIDQSIEHLGKISSVALASLRRDLPGLEEMTQQLTGLYLQGGSVQWEQYYGVKEVNHIPLPLYPWQKEYLWIEGTNIQQANGAAVFKSENPLLGFRYAMASDKNSVIWQNQIGLADFPYLQEHKVKQTVIFPAAGYVELALAAAKETYGDIGRVLEKIQFQHPLTLSEESKTIQVILQRKNDELASFQIFSSLDANEKENNWEEHAQGTIRMADKNKASDHPRFELPESGGVEITAAAHYAAMEEIGIQYGPRFRGVDHILSYDHKAIGYIESPSNLIHGKSAYQFHPALLDACFQVCLASLNAEANSDKSTYLPVGIREFKLMPETTPEGKLKVSVVGHAVNQDATDEYERDIFIFDAEDNCIAQVTGFAFRKVESERKPIQETLYQVEWKEVALETSLENYQPETWLIFETEKGNLDPLIHHLVKEEGSVNIINLNKEDASSADSSIPRYFWSGEKPDDIQPILKSIFESADPPQRIIYDWNAADFKFKSGSDYQCLPLLELVQTLTALNIAKPPILYVITRGVQRVNQELEVNLNGAAVLGLGRVLFHEHPELSCRRIDLDFHANQIDWKACYHELLGEKNEMEYALRGTKKYIPRIKNTRLALDSEKEIKKIKSGDARYFRYFSKEPGILDSVEVREVTKFPELKPDEIKVNVKATGLNFMNVMSALGIYPGFPNGFLCLGIEFAGEVIAIGSEVTDLKIGDRVMGLSPEYDCQGNVTFCKHSQVVRIPDHLRYTEAATIPVAYGTAYISLISFGRLKKGERVLIHSATGGVGMAAIKIAQIAGAEVFATAGSESKRALLRELGVQHVMDSRSLDFADQIRTITQGEGIDMVLNSLTGEAMKESMKLLRGFGRFLEIGKKDIYQHTKLDMDIFKESINYTFFDMYKMIMEKPSLVQEYLGEVISYFDRGEYQLIPYKVYPASNLLEGFNEMVQGKHTGKIVFDLQDPTLEIIPEATPFHSQETMVVTGGIGGLGFEWVQHLMEQGARHIALLGRTNPTSQMSNFIQEKNDQGYAIRFFKTDVRDTISLGNTLQEIRSTMPPITGIFHTAGLLDDGSIMKMTREKFLHPLQPKIDGSWNLHSLTLEDPLKYFVLYSSLASSLGSAGQCNYVAGNAFLDGLGRYRKAKNLPVTVVNWGPVEKVGLAAADDIRGKRLATEGITGYSVTEYVEALHHILQSGESGIIAMHFQYELWVQANPTYRDDKLLEALKLGSETGQVHSDILESYKNRLLETGSRSAALEVVIHDLVQILSGILKTQPGKIDTEAPFASMGLDSLMAIQLRNRISKSMGIQISVTVFWNYPKVKLLSEYIMEELNLALQAEGVTDKPSDPGVEEELSIQAMSESELLDELTKELEKLNN